MQQKIQGQQLMTVSNNLQVAWQQPLPQEITVRCQKTLSKYGGFQQFSNVFSPRNVKKYRDQYGEEKMILSESAPTMTILKYAYGAQESVSIISAYLLDLARYLGAPQSAMEQITNIAEVFETKAHDFKITEVMLFFHMMKSGELRDSRGEDASKMYGSFCGEVIMDCLHRFREYRNRQIDRYTATNHNEKYDEMVRNAASSDERKESLRRGLKEHPESAPMMLALGFITKEEADEYAQRVEQKKSDDELRKAHEEEFHKLYGV